MHYEKIRAEYESRRVLWAGFWSFVAGAGGGTVFGILISWWWLG